MILSEMFGLLLLVAGIACGGVALAFALFPAAGWGFAGLALVLLGGSLTFDFSGGDG